MPTLVTLYQDRAAIVLELPIAHNHLKTFAQFFRLRKQSCPHCQSSKVDPTPSTTGRIKVLAKCDEFKRPERIAALGKIAEEFLAGVA